MTPRDLVWDIWAPPDGRWTPWVKPVLFAHLTRLPVNLLPSPPEARPVERVAPPDTAYVLDLPGAKGLMAWGKLALRGFRPVPLYNAAPGPRGTVHAFAARPDPGDGEPPLSVLGGPPPGSAGPTGAPVYEVSLVDVWSVLDALQEKTRYLEALRLPPDAPPAFLLDSLRRIGQGPVIPRRFDNRSISFPTDFPSANFLLSAGVRRAVLVQEGGTQPQPDLAHTLRRWQEAGLELRLDTLADTGPSLPLDVRKPSGFRNLWHAFLSRMGFRRNALGGFGGMVPEPSSG